MEVFKELPGYPNYLISNYGDVFSIYSGKKLKKMLIRKSGYLVVNIYRDKFPESFLVHQLVAITFLQHEKCKQHRVVDHIDGNKQNNRLDNLQVISQRENSVKDKPKPKSGVTGVYWSTQNKKWQVRPRVSGKKILIGYFDCKETAGEIYRDFSKYMESINIYDYTIEEIQAITKEYRNKLKNIK
jgi:hypothetical protein